MRPRMQYKPEGPIHAGPEIPEFLLTLPDRATGPVVRLAEHSPASGTVDKPDPCHESSPFAPGCDPPTNSSIPATTGANRLDTHRIGRARVVPIPRTASPCHPALQRTKALH